jgi:DNA-binding SARP family transcriptional activator
VAEGGSARGLQRLSDILGAALAALLAFTAVPAVLVVVVGDPLAGGLGHASPPLTRDALLVLTAAAWLAWAACCAQLLRAVVAHVRRGDVGVVHGLSVLDRLAARIAVGVLALTTLGAPLAVSSEAGALTPARSTVTSASSSVDADAYASPAVPAASYVVRPGDTLWSIADVHLGDGADWTSIAALNFDRDVDSGARLVDPDHIRAGWHLRLPGEDRRGPATTTGPPTGREPLGQLPGHLPELVALGLGSLTCAALARRSRRQRRLERFVGDLGPLPPLSERAIDTAALLDRFHGVPALAAFEKANCLLGAVVHERAATRSPVVRAICVGPSGVSFWLAQPELDAPGGFTPVAGGAAWRVVHSRLVHVDVFYPYVPVALPVGDDEEGTWLVTLGPGDVLPVLGESAPALCRAARSALESWTWSDIVTVADDPADPRLADRAAHDPMTSDPCVFFGNPDSLTAAQARRTAVVTTAAVAATDLTLLVDRQGATLHPMGRVVHPQLGSDPTAEDVAELTASRAGRALRLVDTGTIDARRRPPASGVYAPGPVDVRLLTMTPRVDGLREELAPNRARRAVELMAYLALHHPDEITGDRLRTRVLGSSDSDAASKTLFNTAHAARRAMGLDERGDPLFPVGTRNGMYQVSPQVTVDVHRAIALVRAGQEQADPDRAIAHFRAALELVEGEPLANALSGYSWWEAEGHGGRIAAVLVDAACTMALLATEAGLFDLARWGLERARLVEPYSVALSRSALEVAAAEGDGDRLRFEWRECQRRVDTLDPGSSPSLRTESLYGELHHRVLAGTRLAERYAPLSD